MKICTHDGRFHCDEVLACTMLRKFTHKYKQATVIRSRLQKDWDEADIVVDVGGKYAPPKYLDHHQIQFQQTYPNFNIRMSSAGLVYLNFPEIIPNAIQYILLQEKQNLTFEPILNPKIIDDIREKIYKHLIIYVDANDNGVEIVHGKDVSTVPTTLWQRVAKLNPMWWDESSNEYQLFHKAMEVAEQEFISQIKQAFLGSLQTKEIVKEAFNKRMQVHPSGRIVILNKYVPWQKSIASIEEEEKCEGTILYIIFPEKSGKKWRIQAVAKKQGSFELRKGLKSQWRGVKDEEKLKNISGLEDIDFVHASGFIGGAISQNSAIVMGVRSMEE